MHFDLIQTLSLAGKPGVPNDDRIGCADRHAWVIDGATDLGEPGLLGERGGAAWLSSTAQRAFAAASGSLSDICQNVFASIAKAYEHDCRREPFGSWELPRAAFAAVALEGDELVCAHLADCVVLHRGTEGVRFLTPAPDHDDECAAAAALGAGIGAHGVRPPAVLEDRRAARMRAREVLSVDAVCAGENTCHTRHPVSQGDDIVLMSDGLAALLSPYQVLGPEAFIDQLLSNGLDDLARRLRAIEQEDAACLRYPRFKKSDDASAIWLRVA
ncbi:MULTISPECIES: protein phosphatase 2C domain-containing protein [unclassified Pseudomonas]|uniref:protein phosphatase 2C domain-containing protein n=1 Tax=unclassified Pseudomonas TaxID=196821 RepID=UPI0024474D24|nr:MULTISPECIES: protein phosphatase 2C domain-containing protein [unclassified Pseudomonas]MDH0303360.1 protein phosphatase 2C domain-containing protein [Pseudomonas sp. GD04091]MDH1984573.1 protein phosphatase 2C domain-containing protein [Pseudomonas sp. GD03689]